MGLLSVDHWSYKVPAVPEQLVLLHHLVQFRVFLVNSLPEFFQVFPEDDVGLKKVFDHVDRLYELFGFETVGATRPWLMVICGTWFTGRSFLRCLHMLFV